MKSTKKCISCGEWSEWNQQKDDKCTHCGQFLMIEENTRQEERKRKFEIERKDYLFEIHENDNIFQKAVKKVGYVIYLVIMAITSFIVWLLFWLGP